MTSGATARRTLATVDPRRWLPRRGVMAATVVVGLGITLALIWSLRGSSGTQSPATPSLVPVQIAPATTADVPLWVGGLGTVQAYYTVTVHSRVDGQLQRVVFTEGQPVHAGDVLAIIDQRPFQATLEQAMAKKATDEANLANALTNLRRYAELAPRGYTTQQTYDSQQATVRELQATIRGDQAAIDFARTQLEYTTITSPIDGIAGIRLIDPGNIVHATDTTGLVVITQVQPVAVIFTVPAQQLPEIQRAMAAGPVTVRAMNRGSAQPLAEGRLELVNNQIDPTTGMVQLKAIFANADTALWPGQYVNSQVLLRVDHGVLTVPDSAVQRGPDGTFVYVVRPDHTAALQPVQVQRFAAGQAVIASGLQPGAQVVVAGQYRVTPGSRVAATPMPALPAPTSAPTSAPVAVPAPAAAATPAPAPPAAPASAVPPTAPRNRAP